MKFKSLFEIEQEIKKLEEVCRYELTSTQEEKLMTLEALKTQTEAILKMIEEYDLKVKGLGKSSFTWKEVKGGIIRNFMGCNSEEDLLRELSRVVINMNIKQELLTKIQGEQE